MRLTLVLILPVIILNVLLDWYIYRAARLHATKHRRILSRIALWSSVVLTLFIIVITALPKKEGSNSDLVTIMWALYFYFSIYLPKFVWVLIDLIGKLPKLWHRKPLSGARIAASVMAGIIFGAMWFGVINTSRIDVREVTFSDPAVPESFDSLRIAQISDLHTGTYGSDTSFVSKLVDRVNSLQPDLILFTGDIVNRRSDELLPFVNVLARLRAPMGVYSILGNHDYGDYYNWTSPEAKEENMQLLKDLQAGMGWVMLNNASKTFHNQGDSIVLIGVENIGDHPFPVYGDLEKAYPHDLADPAFKILMSHNPAHWVDDIKESPDKNIPLTLSGHTHAMQMSVGRISPAAFRYPTWGGMYGDTDNAHRLYVNIGDGEVAIPARIGATPEITLITLRKGPRDSR